MHSCLSTVPAARVWDIPDRLKLLLLEKRAPDLHTRDPPLRYGPRPLLELLERNNFYDTSKPAATAPKQHDKWGQLGRLGGTEQYQRHIVDFVDFASRRTHRAQRPRLDQVLSRAARLGREPSSYQTMQVVLAG